MSEQPVAIEAQCRLLEYEKLKDEQIARIAYRDQMVHVHLALVGAAMAWTLEHETYHVLLAVPWICIIIGWAYLLNDDRISALGSYIRSHLSPRCIALGTSADIFAWEKVHRTDQRRAERKRTQLFVDEIEFVSSGFLALGGYLWLGNAPSRVSIVVVAVEALLLCALAWQFVRYSDFGE